MYQQIPFRFELKEIYTFDSFIVGDNALVVDLCRQSSKGEGEQQLFIWAEKNQGKSHLLQAACQLSSVENKTSCYLPASQLLEVDVQILQGLESLDLICLDDVHELMGIDRWEEAIFDLINRCREQGATLIFSADLPPDQLTIDLPDLKSRLSWGPVLNLHPLSDEDKFIALTQKATNRGIELPKNVAEYMLRHYPRDLFGLFERLEMLDTASMAMQRKLTIPFVKSVLGR